jgi:CheY-like chemotaxis protein
MSYTAPYLGISLLVVDDDRSLRSMVSRTAQAWSYEISEAPSAEIALSTLATKQHNIILTDIRMGKIDGLTFAEEIRRKFPYTAVAIMTGHPSTESVRKAQDLGAIYYLQKPINMNELGDTLRIATGWSIGMMVQGAAQRYVPRYKGPEKDLEGKLQTIKNAIKRGIKSTSSAGALCKSVYQKDFFSSDLCKQLDIAFTVDEMQAGGQPGQAGKPPVKNLAMERIKQRRGMRAKK